MTTLFTSDHEWLRIEGDVATVGITDYAQSQLGDVVFVELPKVGRSLKKAEAAGASARCRWCRPHNIRIHHMRVLDGHAAECVQSSRVVEIGKAVDR
jgi:hypothetical protein